MKQAEKADVIIIGSGVMGNSTAFYLAQKGLKVIVLEKGQIAEGGSVRNGGCNKINGRGLGELSLSMYGAKEVWPRLAEDLGMDVEYEQVGGYRIALDDAQMDYVSKFIPFGKDAGLTIEELDGNQLRKRVPEFSDKITAALYCKEEARANPLKTTLGYYSKARELGVHFIPGEEVVRLEEQRGKIHAAVTKNGNTYIADKIMVTAGYDSRKILNTVGIDVPMYSYYEEIFVTEKLPKFIDELFISAKVSYYGHQAANGTIIYGGASGKGNFPNRGLYDDSYQTHSRQPATARGLLGIFPGLGKVKVVRAWAGWMDISPDDSMMLGEAENMPGLYIACGFSGHGFGIAPATGKVMSELILEEPLGADISHLHYNRFRKDIDMFTAQDRNHLINAIQKK